MPKTQKPNEKCACNSGKKYKVCCMFRIPDYSFAESGDLASIADIISSFLEKGDGGGCEHTIVNLSNYVTVDTYSKFQIANFYTKIIMLAERNLLNEQVFSSRTTNRNEDILIMYRGSYLIFESKNIDHMTKSICSFISGRDA